MTRVPQAPKGSMSERASGEPGDGVLGGEAPVWARSGPRIVADPATRRGAGAHAVHGHQPRHRVRGLPRRGSPGRARADARAVPGGRLSRAGQVRLPERRRRRERPAGTARSHRLHPVPASIGVRRARIRRHGRARGRPRPPGGARRRGRDRGERAVGCRAPRRRSHHRRRRGDDRLRRRAPRARHPRRRGDASSTWTARRRPSAGSSACAYAHPDDAPRERDIVVDASGSEGGLQFALASERHGGRDHRGELVRRPPGQPPPRRRVPLAAPDDPLEPGRDGRAASTRQPKHRGPARARARAAAGPGVRRAAHRQLVVAGPARRVMAAIADGSSPGLCHTIDWRDAE